MRNRKLSVLYSVLCTILLVGGFVLVFALAWQAGTKETVYALVGMVAGCLLAPIYHEFGHVAMAQAMKMDCVYVKCFCFKISLKKGKKRFSFASPFAVDETQAVPKTGGNMQKRALVYTLGGLIFGGFLLFVVLAAAIVCGCLGVTRYELWGGVPYAAYLFLLNLMPLEYASGKTDMLVFIGLKKGYDAEKNMLAAMEIQGELYEGKTFAEIEERHYYDVPQLCEEEPLYAVMLDLRYHYHLEKDELDKAADCLNRLAKSQGYLSEPELLSVAAELTYMHSLNGNLEAAEDSAKLCCEYLKSETLQAKRVLLAYSLAANKMEALPVLREQAEACMAYERIEGVRKSEEILLSRLKIE